MEPVAEPSTVNVEVALRGDTALDLSQGRGERDLDLDSQRGSGKLGKVSSEVESVFLAQCQATFVDLIGRGTTAGNASDADSVLGAGIGMGGFHQGHGLEPIVGVSRPTSRPQRRPSPDGWRSSN